MTSQQKRRQAALGHHEFPTPGKLEIRSARMMGFLLFHPVPLRIGMAGWGGGSLAKFCRRHPQWKLLQAAFARIRFALKEHSS